ncbi:membrane protein insertase YidC [Aeromicrobium duanguangcaii]|uniref:Membrane protein insertase YidC n=1 Tax=Aeromicrobium duanguangcaii TaxID=2968086 RepID=A0ABY5KES4_9ACTN|nr:membrane protein insertase YidC [Aeromicrobium duanguangcaii]MCD9154403.1 membrane protein insertase YidC [Aeromicrobium duanguangcaii]MCL3838150.1 membrane protein insertase YidC [Aeromicrobium duanguangcaii]UUI68533.1 membrane protein insertase YidC [Aeromicrobium duanguangcaii]
MFDFLGSIGGAIMTPLYYFTSGIVLAWHWLFEQIGLDPNAGWSWALAIVGLTLTIRAMLIPLFVKQINSSRNMQLIQPQLQELRKKYGHDRERFAQEQMKLFQETGTNPFSSCMPLLLQMPIFFALFRVIDQASRKGADGAKGFLTGEQAESLANAEWLGGRIADTFMSSDHLETKIIAMIMVVAMCGTQFFTQKQLMTKNMTAEALNGPFAQQQKILLYVLPVVFAVSGVAFPLGVLVYWTTSNLWTAGQQYWVIRNNPAPGTPAFKAKQERDLAKGKTVQPDPAIQVETETEAQRIKRQQPKKKTRDQRRKSGSPQPKQAKPKPKQNKPAQEDPDE